MIKKSFLIITTALAVAQHGMTYAQNTKSQSWNSVGRTDLYEIYTAQVAEKKNKDGNKLQWTMMSRLPRATPDNDIGSLLRTDVLTFKKLYEINCREETYRVIQLQAFSGEMGRGRLMHSSVMTPEKSPFEYAPPETVEELVVQLSCAK